MGLSHNPTGVDVAKSGAGVSGMGRKGLSWLVREFDGVGRVLDEGVVRKLLTEADLSEGEVGPYVDVPGASYARRTVVRRENYEMLVLTWAPGQASPAHDHSGSLCGLKVVRGELTEQFFEAMPGGYVRPTTASHLGTGNITLDPGVVVHALGNRPEATETLVTVHVYSPPLPEIRRYAVSNEAPAKVYLRKPAAGARTIAVVGGGFTGTMTLANLIRFAGEGKSKEPLHLVLIDRQPAVGDGVAYRTNDGRHLLNVPAGRMSAWPDRPDDFLNFARVKNPGAQAGDFLPRKIYGAYVREILETLARGAPERLSVEIIRDEATSVTPDDAGSTTSTWTIETAGGRSVTADLAIVTVGHRPPDDPFAKKWAGPRNRFVADPWAALVLSQIAPTDSVLLLGSGLTAVDAILSLSRPDRTAPIHVVSRRGLVPLPHLREQKAPADISSLVAGLLDESRPLTIRQLFSSLREHIAAAEATGTDWRQVIDGLRPSLAKLWQRLSVPERARFLRHVRPFWEVRRHRMAPDVSEKIVQLQMEKTLLLSAGSFASAVADEDGVDVTLTPRDCSAKQTVRVEWVINCTGPGIQNRHTTHPILRPLIESGSLAEDQLGLGLHTDAVGRAITATGQTHETLLVAGTLRKSTLWESTAVPELRQQSQVAALTALAAVAEMAAVR